FVQRSGQSTWTVDAQPPTVTAINDISIDSSQNVYIATDKGIYKQALGSSTWTQFPGPAAIPNPQTIFIDYRDRIAVTDATEHGSITKDYGASWNDISLPSAGTAAAVELEGDLIGDLFAV